MTCESYCNFYICAEKLHTGQRRACILQIDQHKQVSSLIVIVYYSVDACEECAVDLMSNHHLPSHDHPLPMHHHFPPQLYILTLSPPLYLLTLPSPTVLTYPTLVHWTYSPCPPRRLGLSHASWSDWGWRRRGRPHEECHRHWLTAGRWTRCVPCLLVRHIICYVFSPIILAVVVVHAFVQQREDVHDLASKSRDIHCIRYIPVSISWHGHARTDIRHFQPPSPAPIPLIICMTKCSMCIVLTGDTVRVSLTEDPEFELVPCSTLIRSAQIYCNIPSYFESVYFLIILNWRSQKIIGQKTSLWLTFFNIFPLSCSFSYSPSLHSIGAEMLSDDSKYTAIPAWTESTRDFMKFNKRKGDLPMQQEGDAMDIRGDISLY